MIEKNIFRFISVLIAFSILLPIGAKNLHIFERPITYAIIWFLILAIFKPKFLFNKMLIWVYLAIVINCFGSLLFWNRDTNYSDLEKILTIISQYVWVALPISMIFYYIKTKDYKGLKIVTFAALFFIFISSITSIVGLLEFPQASRNLAAGTESHDYFMHSLYLRMGITTYGFYAMAMFIIPAFSYYIRNINSFSLKILLNLFIVTVIYSNYMAKHSTILLFAVISFLLSKINFSRKFIIKMALISFSLILSYFVLPDMLISIADNLTDSDVTVRLRDIALVLREADFNPNTSNSYFVTERLGRTEYAMNLFLDNPFLGSGMSSGHAYWMDRLAQIGILGFIPFFMIIINAYKFNLSRFYGEIKIIYNMVFLFFLLFGLIKNMGALEIWFGVFFLVPSLLHLTINEK